MGFLELVLKNLRRRPTRSVVTSLGITIAVATVVSLVGIVDRFKASLSQSYQSHRVDLMVQRAGVSIRMNSSLDEQLIPRLAQLPDVEQVAGTLTDISSGDTTGILGMLVTGMAPDCFLLDDLTLIAGRRLMHDDTRSAIIGQMLAQRTKKQVGDMLEIEGSPFKIVGIFESASLVEGSSAIVLISTLQSLMDRPRQVTELHIRLAGSVADRAAATERLRAPIESMRSSDGLPLGLAVLPAHDYASSMMELRLLDTLAWATSLIALVIGSIGTLNTMLMSVYERTQEIGILRALGWRRVRVLRMILSESLVICLLGAVGGSLLAIGLVAVLKQVPYTAGMIEGTLPAWTFAAGGLMALVVGLVSGIYPAWRGACVLPTEALRHE